VTSLLCFCGPRCIVAYKLMKRSRDSVYNVQAAPAKRGSGQVSLKDIDKLDKVAQRLKDLKAEPSLDAKATRTISELESSLEKACSDDSSKH